MDEDSQAWYYGQLFPYDSLCQLAGLTGELRTTEFVAECDEYRKRYITAGSADELRRAMTAHKTIKSIHVGACYHRTPVKGMAMTPVSKPLVFDIDLDAYYPVYATSNSSDMAANDAALPVAFIGMRIIEYFLVNCFDFDSSDMMLVYSGRRGLHLHCFSPRACALDNEGRKAIAAWLTIHPPKSAGYVSPDSGDEQGNCRLRCAHVLVHPNFSECFKQVVEPLFMGKVLQETSAGGLGVLCSDSSVHQFLHMLDMHSAQLRSLAGEVLAVETGTARYALIKARVASFAQSFKPPAAWPLERLNEVVMTYTWPRIDSAVTGEIGHTIKTPFVAHPKSGRICVPLLGDWSYNPQTALSLSDTERLARELPRLVAQTTAWAGAFKRRHEAKTDEACIEDLVPAPSPAEEKLVRIVIPLEREFAMQVAPSGDVYMSTRLIPKAQPFFLNGDPSEIGSRIAEHVPTEAVLLNKARQAFRAASGAGQKRSDKWASFERMPTAVVMASMPETRANSRAEALLNRMVERTSVECVRSVIDAENWMRANRGAAYVDLGSH